ncbi:hypothetical protein PI124_g19701 [Phytophthora idaei]|nr:hypothetical protein PI124_g19701 [Phytophthora idaei]
MQLNVSRDETLRLGGAFSRRRCEATHTAQKPQEIKSNWSKHSAQPTSQSITIFQRKGERHGNADQDNPGGAIPSREPPDKISSQEMKKKVVIDLTSASGDSEEELQEEQMKANQQHKINKENQEEKRDSSPRKTKKPAAAQL